MKIFNITLLLTFFIVTTSLHAQNKGEVTSKSCPYSCKTLGIKKKNCKDWRENGMCFVEDLRKPSNLKGKITKRACPYSCRTENINKRYCKDWREGSICVIEDLRTPATKTSSTATSITSKSPSLDSRRACRETPRNRLPRNYINIGKVKKSGNLFKPYYRVYGSIEGTCVLEAGYYQHDRLQKKFNIPMNKEFGRYEFNIQVRGDKNPEIRVYNIHGDRDSITIDPDDWN